MWRRLEKLTGVEVTRYEDDGVRLWRLELGVRSGGGLR